MLLFRLAFGSLTFLATSGAGLLLGLFLFGGRWVELRLRKPLDEMIGPCAELDAGGCGALNAGALDQLSWLIWIVPAVVLAVNWWKGKAAAEALDDRLVGRFNHDFLRPVGKPRGVSGSAFALPWIDSVSEERAAAWQSLRTLVRFSRDSTAGHSLAWGMIVGRPGSGKTRLVEEFARRLRAGTVDPGARPGRPVAAWLRRLMGTTRLRAADPWHVGHLPDLVDWDQLRSWRPGRPTLLLLDDPAPGVADGWLAALYGRRSRWRFPVRLLIANQSIPLQLPIGLSEGRWTAQRAEPPMPCDVQVLARESRFTKEDLRRLLQECARAGDAVPCRHLSSDGPIDRFLDVTRGNPLLIELGLEWVRGGKDPAKINELALYEDRAGNVLRGLASAGIGTDQPNKLGALAAATLVGPRARREPILEAFHQPDLPRGEALLKLIPGDDGFDPYAELPAILPHQIGDVVVRLIVDDPRLPPGRAEASEAAARVAAAGFAARPAGWLRALQRLGREPGVLAEALGRLPSIDPADFPTREAIASAYMELGLFAEVPVERVTAAFSAILNEATAPCRAQLADRLRQRLGALVEADSEARRASLHGLHPEEAREDEDRLTDPFNGFIHALPLGVIATMLLAARLAGETERKPGSAYELLAILYEMNVRAPSAVSGTGDQTACLEACLKDVLLESAFDGETLAAALPDISLQELNWPENVLCNAVLEAYDTERFTFRDWKTNAVAIAIARADDLEACRKYVVLLDEWVCKNAAEDPWSQAQRLGAWLCVAANEAAPEQELREIVQRAEEVAACPGLAGDLRLERARALAWFRLAIFLAEARDVAGWSAAVERIAGIAGRPDLTDDAVIRLAYANASAKDAYVHSFDPDAARRGVARVDSIAMGRNGPLERRFHLARIDSRRQLVAALKDDPAACEEAIRDAETLASLDVFAADRDIQFSRVTMYAVLAYASRSDLGACRRAVDKAEAIGSHPAFASDWMMQADRARAWRNLADAAQANPRVCRDAAERVERIAAAEKLAARPEIAEQWASAWGYCLQATVDDPALCRRIADRIELVAASPEWRDNGPIQFERVEAWAHLSRAYAQVDDSLGCHQASSRAIESAGRYPDDPDMQALCAFALRNLVYVRRRRPDALEPLHRIEEIVSRFPANRELVVQLEIARDFLK